MTPEIELRQVLDGVRARWRATAVLSALARGVAASAAILLVTLIIERLWQPSAGPLLVLAAVAVVAILGVPLLALWPVRRRPADRHVARLIEERCPQLEDRIASAAQFSAEPTGSLLHDLLISDATSKLREIEPDAVVSRSAVKRSALQAGAALGALAVILGVGGGSTRRVLHAVSLYAFPHTVTLEVEPGDVRIVAGEPLRIVARFDQGPNGTAGVVPTLTIADGGGLRETEMDTAEGEFALELPAVGAGFSYRVAAGAVESPEYDVTVVHPPTIDRIDVRYRYPSFSGLDPRVETDGGDIYAPAGTDVTLEVHTSKPIRAGALVMDEGPRIDMTPGDDAEGRVVEVDFRVDRDGSYRVSLSDRDDLTSPGDTEYFIRVMDDRPPTVRVLRPAGDRQVTPLEEVTIEARADDDYGVEALELVVSVRGGEELVVPLPVPATARSITGAHTIYGEDLGLQPGDFVTYYAQARDVSRGKRSTEARSDIFFLEVTPFDAEFAAAQSQSMMGAGGRSLDDLATAQKQIIVATWKLDRRAATAGRSVEDIQSIGRAQGELRVRVEQAAQRTAEGLPRQPGRRLRRGEDTAPRDAPPLEKAATAMAGAQAALEATDTSGALPHEMEALNQLLKAQADVREQQVARQQSSGAGGGGGNRSNQDLSALFDRELRRQQETNYETRDTAATPETAPGSEALDRVRELARRQDELSRQQRELARERAGLDPEEIKRRLERLTREQSELRQRAQELARRMSESRSESGGQRSEGGDRTSAQAGLEAASDEMRSATSGLRRQDLEEAGSRSARAADRLRELERELLEQMPEERRRAMGEMQREAQQLAEGQRRVAAETQRLDGERVAEATARRLAGEQEDLAARVEQLRRGLGELISTEGPAAERSEVGQAAEELERSDVESRLRESAAAFRELAEASGTPTAPGGDDRLERLVEREERLADDLARVVESMAYAGADDQSPSRRLSEQLARAQELRSELDALQRELDDRMPGRRGDDEPANSGREGQEPGRGESGSPRDGSSPPADPAGGERGGPDDEGAPGAQGLGGQGGDVEVTRLREEYAQRLREAQALVDEIRRDNPGLGGTPEEHRYSRSAPGIEAFKQDRSDWSVLRREVGLALELAEGALSERLSELEARDRLNAGAHERLPDHYESLVDRYYQSLANTNKH